MEWTHGEVTQEFTAEVFDLATGLSVSHKYNLPDGITEHQVAGLLHETMNCSDDDDRLKDLMVECFTLLETIKKGEPGLRIHADDFSDIHYALHGIVSRYNPSDVTFFVNEWMRTTKDGQLDPFDEWHMEHRVKLAALEEQLGVEINWVMSPTTLRSITCVKDL